MKIQLGVIIVIYFRLVVHIIGTTQEHKKWLAMQ